VDPKKLPPSFVGRVYDHKFVDDLPKAVDPCGENGEFHTCVLAGPMLREPVHAALGVIVERDGFYFADLVLTKSGHHSQSTSGPNAPAI
jgi:diphthamide synthase (EF-2-diphthine--ammonia ligase)